MTERKIKESFEMVKTRLEIDQRTQQVNKFGFTANTPKLTREYKRLWQKENRDFLKKRRGEKTPIVKQCVICSKQFPVSIKTGARAITCSKQCSKINQHNWLKTHGWGRTRDYRILVIHVLGGKCAYCKFDDIRALQIDHINGDGYKEAKKFGTYGYRYYKHVWNQVKTGGSDKYQILCANCNWIKRTKQKETNQWRSTNRKAFQKMLIEAQKIGEKLV